jgi:hypothetical protein
MRGMDVPQEHLEGIDPDDLVTLELVTRFGWTIPQAEEAPAAKADWLLQIARVRDEVSAERQGQG